MNLLPPSLKLPPQEPDGDHATDSRYARFP
jgi:hypothetical protein